VRVRATLACGWALALLAASLQPGGDGGFALASPFGLVGPDKWLHAAGYAVLAALVAAAVLARTRRRHLVVLVAVVGYGALVELLQIPVAGRSGDPMDALANAVGAALGLALWWGIVRRRAVGDAGSEST